MYLLSRMGQGYSISVYKARDGCGNQRESLRTEPAHRKEVIPSKPFQSVLYSCGSNVSGTFRI